MARTEYLRFNQKGLSHTAAVPSVPTSVTEPAADIRWVSPNRAGFALLCLQLVGPLVLMGRLLRGEESSQGDQSLLLAPQKLSYCFSETQSPPAREADAVGHQ